MDEHTDASFSNTGNAQRLGPVPAFVGDLELPCTLTHRHDETRQVKYFESERRWELGGLKDGRYKGACTLPERYNGGDLQCTFDMAVNVGRTRQLISGRAAAQQEEIKGSFEEMEE